MSTRWSLPMLSEITNRVNVIHEQAGWLGYKLSNSDMVLGPHNLTKYGALAPGFYR